jgi:hypothetical protein
MFMMNLAAMVSDDLPTANRLRELLNYDPQTGIFIRKRLSHRRADGPFHHGYRAILIDRKKHLAHRVAWCFVYGEWPSSEIDHVNCVKSDNRIANLRLATRSQNNANRRPLYRTIKGVTRHKAGGWQAQIKESGRSYYLGLFKDQEHAAACYRIAAAAIHGEFAYNAPPCP